MVACSSSSSGAAPSVDAGQPPDGAAPATKDADADSGGNVESGADAGSNGLAWTSGTRLRAVVDAVETARIFSSWHDVALDVDCDYALSSDGKTRCLPVNQGFSEYDDSNCTNPVGIVPTGGAPVKYLSPPHGVFVCGKGTELHAVGASYVPAARYTFDGTSCVPDTSTPTNTSYVHFGAVVPATTFVAATQVSDPRGTRLSAHQYFGDDGSRQDFEMLDKSRANASCEVTDDGTGKVYCTPKERAYTEVFFSDAACTTAVGLHPEYAQQVCGRTPTAVQDSTGKVKVLTFFEVGARITTPVYETNGASCQLVAGPTLVDDGFYAVGAPLPLASLASLPVSNEGNGRVQLTVARTESGALGASLGFFDSQKNIGCRKSLAADGKVRCLPNTRFDVRVFADAQCSQGLLTIATGAAPPPAGTLLRAQAALPFSSANFVIGAKVAAPASVWSWNGNTTCQAAAVELVDYYATIPVPPTDFALVTTAPE